MFGKRRIKELEIALEATRGKLSQVNAEKDLAVEGTNNLIHKSLKLYSEIDQLNDRISELTRSNTPQQTTKEQKAIKDIQQKQREFFLSDKTVQDKVEMLFDDMIISLSELSALRNPKTSIEKFMEILSKIDMRYLNLGRE
jgi:chromosome segregation ATPase